MDQITLVDLLLRLVSKVVLRPMVEQGLHKIEESWSVITVLEPASSQQSVNARERRPGLSKICCSACQLNYTGQTYMVRKYLRWSFRSILISSMKRNILLIASFTILTGKQESQ